MHRVSTLDFIHHSRGSRTCLKLKIDLCPGDNHPDNGVDSHSRIVNILDLAGLLQERNLDYKYIQKARTLNRPHQLGRTLPQKLRIMGGDGAATACAVAEQPNPTLETGHGWARKNPCSGIAKSLMQPEPAGERPIRHSHQSPEQPKKENKLPKLYCGWSTQLRCHWVPLCSAIASVEPSMPSKLWWIGIVAPYVPH
jgi:hypothetical protein